MQIAEYIMAKRSDKLAIQSSASIPRARARIHTLMPETTAARKLRTTHTVTMVRHSEAASTSGVAFTTQGIAAVFRFWWLVFVAGESRVAGWRGRGARAGGAVPFYRVES